MTWESGRPPLFVFVCACVKDGEMEERVYMRECVREGVGEGVCVRVRGGSRLFVAKHDLR